MIRRLLLLVLATAVTVAGCARIPFDGPVMGPRAGDEQSRVRALVPPPAPGADPDTVVGGFLRAGLSPGGDYAQGRAYLAGPGSHGWTPSRQTLVYSGEPEVRMRRDLEAGVATALVTVTVGYEVDEAGRLSTGPAGTERELQFRLTSGTGEWRITQAPDLTLVSEQDFGFVFEPYALYFLDPSTTYLVPEPRWLASTEETGSRLVDLLLTGPPGWLGGAATTAFPAGTSRLGGLQVSGSSEVLDVPLSRHVADAPEPARALMQAQLLATLQQVSGAPQVRILADGSAVTAPDVQVRALPETVEDPVVLREGSIFEVDGGRVRAVDVPGQADADPSDPAVDYTGRRLAVLLQDRTRLRLLHSGTGNGHTAVTGTGLTPPSFDWRGWVWTADRDGTVHAVPPDGQATTVPAAFLTGRRPLALRIAPDGARAAVLSTDAGGQVRILVVAVRRDLRGTPVELTAGPQSRVAEHLVGASDLSWAGGLDLVVLGRTADGPERPLRVQLGGPPHEPWGRVAGSTRVTAASTLSSTLVGTSDTVLTRAGAGWVALPGLEGASDPAYPG